MNWWLIPAWILAFTLYVFMFWIWPMAINDGIKKAWPVIAFIHLLIGGSVSAAVLVWFYFLS